MSNITRTHKLRRHYSQLTVHERVQLLLSAEGRGDRDDMLALDTSCPGEDVHPYIIHLMTLEQAAGVLVAQLLAREALLYATFITGEDESDPDRHPVCALETILAAQAAIWRGFVAWCNDIGHDPRHVLLFAPVSPDRADPARFIIDQQLQRFESHSQDRLSGQDRSRLWHDFFTQAYPIKT